MFCYFQMYCTIIFSVSIANVSQPIWATNMYSKSSDVCYTQSNTCPNSTIMTNCSHSNDILIQCSELTHCLLFSSLYIEDISAFEMNDVENDSCNHLSGKSNQVGYVQWIV